MSGPGRAGISLRPHVAHAVVEADQAGITQPTAGLMNELGLLLYAKALYTEAEPLMRRALAIDEQSFGQDHPKSPQPQQPGPVAAGHQPAGGGRALDAAGAGH